MDHNVGQLLDAVDRFGIRDNTIVIFMSDNGPEGVRPWDGWAGPWRGHYFTAWEGGIRAPFLIRWPGRIPAGRVSDGIVHGVDLFPTLASIVGAAVPSDRAIDGVDQSNLFLGKTEMAKPSPHIRRPSQSRGGSLLLRQAGYKHQRWSDC